MVYKNKEIQIKREQLLKGIANNKQSMWIWIIIGILFCWTIIGAIGGIIGAFVCHDMKTKKEIELSKL
jgi:uncharacterized membrane protein